LIGSEFTAMDQIMGKAASPMALTAELVARCHRDERDPGPNPADRHLTDEDFKAAAAALLQQKPPGDLWVFAYGSLMWKPACAWAEHRRATAHGWHRAFSLKLTRWRGSRQQPGLMMALERGGRCAGIVFRIPAAEQAEQLRRLLRREVSGRLGLSAIRWLKVETEAGPLKALAFWADARGLDRALGLPLPRVAEILARACGHVGSGAEYLFHTVTKLEELGIRDRNLWRLQQLVADEILRMMPATDFKAPRQAARHP
jgi:glutathione-specific gamma-glutamylcyclotransferase